MIQITGLTKVYRRGRPPALLDLGFDARPGAVTVLLGDEGAGKTTALRLMVELERGLGITLFDGRTYRRLRRPERELGVLLPSSRPTAGHPGQRARSHLRMLAGAVGVPARRADELLEQTRLAAVADHRLRSFSPGMHRRMALAAALLGDPKALLLDDPTEGLSPRNEEWFHSFLRSFAVAGGTLVVTTRSPQEAAAFGDRVVTLDRGRMLADQPVAEFRRTRLHPEVAVRGPQMARLADLLVGHGAQVRRDGGAGLAVSGIGRTEIGELAYRHGILLHELADRVVEQPAPRVVLPTGSGRSGQVRVRSRHRDAEPVPAARPQSPPAAVPGEPSSGGPLFEEPLPRVSRSRRPSQESLVPVVERSGAGLPGRESGAADAPTAVIPSVAAAETEAERTVVLGPPVAAGPDLRPMRRSVPPLFRDEQHHRTEPEPEPEPEP
ncbi:hypothetical protein GCM10010441_48460 [Kitasatospora paracochleata]|uniref:ABC-2 type transport system ATP-binding protein n=1 Tax=Kitasatospora paracochleata TaxID=58354 RepID=A0ABT1ISG0_9ACTN|nr:ABC transporter ATP-binding protein [Kitasatospora paracochleata]MCP2307873.1 ABC-2 type transport system ATP-binding protein [Kitasatospora paracochleata]